MVRGSDVHGWAERLRLARPLLAPCSLLSLALLSACGSSTAPPLDDEVAGSGTGGDSSAGGATGRGGGGFAQGEVGGGGRGPRGGSNSATGGGSAGGGSSDLLVDDFEDGDERSVDGAQWYSYNDRSNGGQSVASHSTSLGTGKGYRSNGSMLLKSDFDKGTSPYDPYTGLGVNVSGLGGLDGYSAVSYVYKGAAHSIRLQTSNVTDYDFYNVRLPYSSNWKDVTLSYSAFAQAGWGKPVPLAMDQLESLTWEFKGATGQSATFEIDDVRFVEKLSNVSDMQVRAPQVPTRTSIETLAIQNPLQETARRYLDKGVNLTNWLEDKRFTDFTFDENTVKAFARAGFKSIRLPIDFDLYVTNTNTAAPTVHDDLFLVLDSFERWTRAAGLGFTIDYHQYDHSFDITKPDSVELWVGLWSLVAAHYAQNPRTDLFYELLNEPELASVQGHLPTSEQWTSAAVRAITAIRAHDAARPIIFGDIDYYGITALSKRAPLEDPNVIYVFHFYDPFVFTHQGADWADMAATKNIPYPYSPERWSTSFADFGFTNYHPTWQLDQLKNYYKNGNSAALYNRIAEAKRWAVSHNVPVICNEFGAYDRSSAVEDRQRYHADLVQVFAELEIPWQVWFSIMDPKTGAVSPGDRAAFQLVGTDVPADAGAATDAGAAIGVEAGGAAEARAPNDANLAADAAAD